MKKRTLLCMAGTGLVWASVAVTLAACQPPIPEPVPGQPLTWAQKHQLDLQEAQDMHDRRKVDRPCGGNPKDCMN
jgi:hypothetical protein